MVDFSRLNRVSWISRSRDKLIFCGGQGNQKRRRGDANSDPETPRLFTSNFKVPKLKKEIKL